jgi:hypothetical protein
VNERTALDRRLCQLWQQLARRYDALERALRQDDDDPRLLLWDLLRLERVRLQLQDIGEAYDRLTLEGARHD